jgi:glycosyltransferase involved in cell wall biosynthesis
MGTCSDEEIRQLYRESQALLLPGAEDFGIAPVEALACGRPVVALARGGVTETVRHGTTGVLVESQTAEAFADGIAHALRLRFDPTHLREQSLKFSLDRFYAEMRTCLEQAVAPAESGFA